MMCLASKPLRLALLLAPSAAVGAALLGCLEPVPSHVPTNCSAPEIVTAFCHGPTCKRAETDTCAILTHAMLVEHYRSVDAVVLPARTCQGPLRPGPLHLHVPPLNRIISNEPLVTVQVKGRELLELLEHGLELRHVLRREDAFPRVAGLRYTVYPKRNRTRIARPAVLSTTACHWSPVQPQAAYRILTVPSWLQQSRSLPVASRLLDSAEFAEEGDDVLQAFGAYAQRVCAIRDPFQRRDRNNDRGVSGRRPVVRVLPVVLRGANATMGSPRKEGPHISTTSARSR